MIRSGFARVVGRLPGCAVAAVLVFAAGCDEGTEVAESAPRAVMCRKLMEHILQITPRPGSDRPETDPARIQQLAARIPIEDIDQCAAPKDAAPKDAAKAAKKDAVIACMQAAGDVAALRACIPAQAE
jgi:hypothetical protein